MIGFLGPALQALLPALLPKLHDHPVSELGSQADAAVRQFVTAPKDRARVALILRDLVVRLERQP